ncbi:uncharacterized protein [Cicer arietinum]|uniref:uncharacterized protein n=1 Tax=Cicer arietinum TaxID=3827 RepID=UPI003CC5EB0B
MVSQDHQQLSSAVICESILQMVTANPTISVSVLIAHIRPRGFDHCKPVVSVDGTWLYGKYRGTLLMAITQDGDGHTIPIAYAVVEDRHESIKSVVRRVNSNWHHVFCVRHISQNFMRTFKNGLMKDLVTNMGYAMTQPSITYFRRQISDWSQDAVKWLDDIPKEQWLQAYDEGRRWEHMTTNLSECMNNVLKGTRNLPISSLVQATYYRVTAKFEERGTQAQAMMT